MRGTQGAKLLANSIDLISSKPFLESLAEAFSVGISSFGRSQLPEEFPVMRAALIDLMKAALIPNYQL